MITLKGIRARAKNPQKDANSPTIGPTITVLSIAAPPALLNESASAGRLEEGSWRPWDSKFDVRLDRRPDHMGGDQIHIRSRNGSEWAYRHTGGRSEAGKYTLPANKDVRDIVRHYFNVDLKESALILIESATEAALIATWQLIPDTATRK